MKTSALIWILGIIVVILGAWYWYSSSQAAYQAGGIASYGTAADTDTAGSEYKPGNLLLGTDATSTLGTYLIGSNGMTLYTYAEDANGISSCTGTCAQNWPPYIVASTDPLVNLESGVNGISGTIVRADGSMQVTYSGMPLYFFSGDTVSGDLSGEGAGSGAWNIARP